MIAFRFSRLIILITAAILIASSLHADQLRDEAIPLAEVNDPKNVPPVATELSQLPMDCGDQKTVIARSAKTDEPLKLDSSNPTEEDWAAYERKVRERFNVEPVAENAETNDESKLEYVEGCALDEWQTDQKNPNINQDSDVEVFRTGMDEIRTKVADKPKDNHLSGGSGTQETAQSRPSAKSAEDRFSIEKLLDMLVVQIILAVGLATALFFILRYLVQIVIGYFFRRRTCRISADLFTNKFSFSGQILVLGKKGCRFVPEDYALLDKVLDIPEFLKFSISAGEVTKPVFVDRTHGTAVAAFFNTNLSRAEQEAMLKRSTIEVKFDRWRPPKSSRKKGIKSVKERIAKLNQLREEELARKAMEPKP